LNTAATVILVAYLVKESFEYIVQYLNLRHMERFGTTVPPEFRGIINESMLAKMRDYEADKTRLSFLSSVFGNIVTIAFIFGGLLNVFNSWIISFNESFVVSGWLFFMLLTFSIELLSTPFSLYEHFRVENKYGFNTLTARLWISDFIKSLLLSAVLMSILLLVAFLLIQWSPAHWWLWVWGVMLVYGLLVMYISPYAIEPLFNKFAPIEDGSLKERIVGLAGKAGINVTKVLKMDASKRSRHSNAYFAGLGRTKRIVLFDTLLNGMTHNEIIAVLAHEIGHWKRKHVLKTIAAMEFMSLIALYISYRLIEGDLLNLLFKLDAPTIYGKLVIIGFIAGIVAFPLKLFATYFSRHHEREADRDCLELTGNVDDAVSAFVTLAKENLSNLYPHPLYVLLYYSHPPMLERIRYIKESTSTLKET
jgi:STE24 endopeptidase